MKPLTKATIERFVTLLSDRLDGRWVLMGGALIPLLGGNHRVTYDIDLAGPRDASHAQMLALLDLANEIGLPVESVNQSAAYFLSKIPGFEEELLPLRTGARGIVVRPTATLYIQLKLRRLTESDLADCLFYLDYAINHQEPLDIALLRRAATRPGRRSPASKRRLAKLRAALARSRPAG